MNHLRYLLSFICCCLVGLVNTSCLAQHTPQWQIEPSFHLGKIIQHTPQFKVQYGLSTGAELYIGEQTYGRHSWEQAKRYPALGLSLMYFNLGNNKELGYSIGIFPKLSIPIFRNQRSFINFALGAGIARLNRPFHEINNPNNILVSSHWNSIVAFQFLSGYHFNSYWTGNIGVSFTHYSNGGTMHPNYGINIVGGTIGVKYTPNPKTRILFTPSATTPLKKWGTQIHGAIAFREYNRNRKLLPIYMASVGVSYHFNTYNRGIAGIEIERNISGAKSLIEQNWNKSDAYKETTRHMFFIADEIIYGRFSLLLQIGVYFQQKELTLEPFYNRLALRYHFPMIKKSNNIFFAGIYLKSHLAVAEYIAVGFGLNF